MKLVFNETYPGTGKGDTYFGVGRIDLTGINYFSEAPDTLSLPRESINSGKEITPSVRKTTPAAQQTTPPSTNTT